MIIPPATIATLKNLWEAGHDAASISGQTGIPEKDIKAAARKGKWVRQSGLVSAQTKAVAKGKQKIANTTQDEIAGAVAANFPGAAKAHAQAMFIVTSTALRTTKMPKLRTWRDVKHADDIARRNGGLDDKGSGGAGTVINLGIVCGTSGVAVTGAEKKTVDVQAAPANSNT